MLKTGQIKLETAKARWTSHQGDHWFLWENSCRGADPRHSHWDRQDNEDVEAAPPGSLAVKRREKQQWQA